MRTPTGEGIVIEIKVADPIGAGTQVFVDFDPAHAYYFDADTNLRQR